MPTALIDTVSLNHSLKATHKRLDYSSLMEWLYNTFDCKTFTFFIDADAHSFLKYITDLKQGEYLFDKTIITKQPYRKKIGLGDKLWYISFAVDIALHVQRNDIIISTDYEILPILKLYDTTLIGLGIPLDLRNQANYWDNIPDECYI